MKVLNWLSRKKVKKNLYGYTLRPDMVYSHHHYISKEFKMLYLDVSILEDEKLFEFMTRFSKDYKFLIKMPEWSYVYSENTDSFLDTMRYVSRVMDYSDNILGLVLEVGEHLMDKRTALNSLGTVFIRRTLDSLIRKGVGLYLVNGVVRKGHSGITLADMLQVRKSIPRLKLILNLHNSVVSGQSFMDVFVENNTIGGLAKNFDMVVLTGTDNKGQEIVPVTHGDRFSYSDYKRFLGQFKEKAVIYKGGFESVLNLHKRLIDGTV